MVENTKDMVSPHDLLYETPPRIWEDGFPVGNGQFGGMVWQPEDPDRIVIGVTKLDVWDLRFREDKLLGFDRFRELARTDPEQAVREVNSEPAYDPPYPCPKVCGRLTIGLDEGFLPLNATLFRQEQRLRLYEASVECEYEISTKAVRVTTFVDSESNVMVAHLQNTWAHQTFRQPHRQLVMLSREIDETLGMPQTGSRDGALYIRYVFPDGFSYVMAAVVDGVKTSEPFSTPAEVKLYAELPRAAVGPVYSVYLSVVTSLEAEDPLAAALANLMRARQAGYEAIRARHERWWASFWQASGVELGDRFLEGLWYFNLYQLASTCRGKTAPGLFGLWNMAASPAWHGDYHGDYNVSMAHWFLFSSNHLELGEPYFQTFSRMLPAAKRQTLEHYGIDGAKYPIATDPNGVEMTRHWYRMMICSSAYYALVYLWHYRYTLDRDFLASVTFPILEESTKFYLALTEKGPDGKLRIGPSQSPEQGPLPAYNVTNDLALIKPLWEGYAEACRLLHRESAISRRVSECLASYPDYPQKNGRFLDSLTAPEDLLMAHIGLVSMVYPGGEVDADHPLAAVAARTVDTHFDRSQRKSFTGRRTMSDVQAWVMQALASARLRRTTELDRYLMQEGLSEYLKPNGMITIISNGIFRSLESKRAAYEFVSGTGRAEHVLVACANTRHGRDRQFQFLEGSSAYLCVVNEMLLQSHGGVLRIFPAVPERIADCAFVDLRGEGAFLVSARSTGGRSESVEITSLAGATCTLRLFRYDGKAPVRSTGPDGELRAERIAPDTWRFSTVRGGRYRFAVGGASQDIRLKPSAEPAGVKHFVDRYGDKVFYGKPAVPEL